MSHLNPSNQVPIAVLVQKWFLTKSQTISECGCDKGKPSLLIFLGLSAAFDIGSQEILLYLGEVMA